MVLRSKRHDKKEEDQTKKCQQDPRFFATANTLETLNEIGFTRAKSTQEGYAEGYWRGFTMDIGYLVAPQNWKSEEMYRKLPMKPRQMQTLYCGSMIWPIPSGPRTFYKKEGQDAQDLAQCVWVRGFYVPHAEIQQQLKEFYAEKPHPEDMSA